MELTAPEWLTNEFLTQCLLNEEDKQHVEVKGFNISSVVPPGNNYGSCLLRVKLQYKDHNNGKDLKVLYLIIKSELTDDLEKEIVGSLKSSESEYYKMFIPEAKKISETSFLPKAYTSPIDSVVVLEDLKEIGFKMADRTKLLDFEHCRYYVEAAAWFHAVAFAVHKEHPELVEAIGKEKVYCTASKATEVFKNMVMYSFQCFSDSTKRIDQFSKYSKLIRDISPILWRMMEETHRPSELLNTLIQGDPWLTNMMFKYDDKGSLTHIKLLDFQLLSYGSPMYDLVFFIWTSANHDVRSGRLEELYEVYIEAFNNRLQGFNCSKRLTYEHLKNDIRKLSPLAIFLVGAKNPIDWTSSAIDLGLLVQNDKTNKPIKNPYQQFYDDKFCNNHLPKLLEQLEMQGIFNFLENYNKQ